MDLALCSNNMFFEKNCFHHNSSADFSTFVYMIDHATIERILDAAQITDVVSDFVTLRKRGVNQLGLCPFHNEKTPSFTVSPAKGIFSGVKGRDPILLPRAFLNVSAAERGEMR